MNNIGIIGKRCCGCRSCEQICHLKAITFQENEEGFLYPTVGTACVSCGKCLKHCPINTRVKHDEGARGYAASLTNREALMNSSSGGVFYALAKVVLDKNGVVFGCAEDVPGKPHHVLVSSMDQLPRLQGSKYVESYIGSIYSDVKAALDSGKTVLFSGTPCQVAGVTNFVGKREKLYTVDIICHGVPSRKLYQKYLSYVEAKRNTPVSRFLFRSKHKHQWSLTYLIEYSNKKHEEHIASLSPYYSHFLKAYNYRESCYTCPYASRIRPGDITIGDFWGVEAVDESLFSPDGVSAVLINTAHGQQLLDESSAELLLHEVNTEDIIKHNGQLRDPAVRPIVRDNYYDLLNKKGFDWLVKSLYDRKELLFDTIKDYFPNKIRHRIKKCLNSSSK